MEISAAFLSSFGRLNNDKLQSISPAVNDIKFHDKNIFKGENAYKNHIKNISIFVRLATAKPLFFNGHKLPARANGTKREAIWYSELYLFGKGIEKEPTEVMNYVVFSMPYGKI